MLGQRFELEAWRALVDVPLLEPLVDAGLLRPDDAAAQFVHALIRDGAYASLLKTRRRELHLRAAAWYATRDLGLHAEHLALADSPLAAAAFGHAARAELERYRYAEAQALAERGLRCATNAAERHALALLLGETLREQGRNAEALAAFTHARDDAEDEADAARASYEMATVHRLLAQVDAAWQALDAAEPMAQQLGATRWLSGIHYLRGNLCFARGDGAGCAREHQQALDLALACGDALAEAQALSGLGDAHYAAGRMHSALAAFERCVAACERAGALRFAVMNRAMVGWCCYWHGRADDCRRELFTAGAAAVALVAPQCRGDGHRIAGLDAQLDGRPGCTVDAAARGAAVARGRHEALRDGQPRRPGRRGAAQRRPRRGAGAGAPGLAAVRGSRRPGLRRAAGVAGDCRQHARCRRGRSPRCSRSSRC